MLVSHDYKFIFIKPKKVAGSSIQAYLSGFCRNGINYSRPPKSHLTADKTRELVGEVVWDSYTKITVVRNPWDKIVSLYYWRSRKRAIYIRVWRVIRGYSWHSPAHKLEFSEYVKYLYDHGKLNIDEPIIYSRDSLPEYEIVRFEQMHEDMLRICQYLGIKYNRAQMPQKKVGYRKVRAYRDMYTDETKRLVAQAYQSEIERFGYSF